METIIRPSHMVLKSARYNKRKSVLSILTIAMAVSLLMVVFTYLYNNSKRVQLQAIKNCEEYHAEFKNVSKWQAKKLKLNKLFKETATVVTANDIHVINNKVEQLQLSIKAQCINEASDSCDFYLGREPKEENEIVLDKWFMEVLNIPLEVNQDISLKFASKNTMGTESSQQFHVVGIRKDIVEQRIKNVSSILFSSKFIENNSDSYEVGIRVKLKSNFNCLDRLKTIATGIGMQQSQIEVNVEYVDAFNVSISTILIYIVIVFLITIVASVVIYNIFSIYMIQKIKLYGTLKAIGFTKSQQARFILLEGVLLAVIGGFIGEILGVGLSKLFIVLLGGTENQILSETSVIYFPILIICFLFGIFIVLIGILRPMQKVLKMSEIEAMRFQSATSDMRSFSKQTCVEKLTINSIIVKSLNRNRKRTIYHMGAIVLTGSIFIMVTTILSSMDIDNMVNSTIRGDFSLQLADDISRVSSGEDVITLDLIEELRKEEGIDSLDTVKYSRLNWSENDAKKYINLTDEFLELGLGYGDMDSIFYGYEDAYMKDVINQLGESDITLDRMKNENVAIAVKDGISNIKKADKIKLIDPVTDKEVIIEVVGVIDNNITYRGYKASANDFIIHQNLLTKLGLDDRIQRVLISANDSKMKEVKSYLMDITTQKEDKLCVVSYADLNKEYSEQKNTISVSAYSFVIVLFLIAICNLVNSTFANIMARKREIGIMQAVGLTNPQLNAMLQLENLSVVAVSCVVASILGILLGYVAVNVMQRQATYMSYAVSWGAIGLMFAVFVVVQILVTALAKREINRDTTIAKIRYVEV